MFLTCTNGIGAWMRSNWHLGVGRHFQMLEGRSSSWLLRLGSCECCLQKCLQTTGSWKQLSGRSFAPTWLQTKKKGKFVAFFLFVSVLRSHSQSPVLVWIQNEQSKGRRHEAQVSNWLPEISSCKHNFCFMNFDSNEWYLLKSAISKHTSGKKDFKSPAINTFGL